jgi:site-specific DNA-methyltransferase (adenine-specific)
MEKMIKLMNNDIIKADFTGVPPINLVVTSPPYNVGIEYDKHVDTMTYDQYLVWCKQWLTILYNQLADDGRICINIPFSVTPEHLNKVKGDDDINYPVTADYTKICIEVGFKYWRTLIWDKNHSNKTCWGSWRSASAPFMRDPSEAILVFYKNVWKRKSKGISTIAGKDFMSWTKNVWKIHPETNSKHPAAFPPELPNRCIQLLSYKDDVICDCFMGSGTTGDIAVRLNRNFVGIEMSNDYFQMSKDRIEKAELQASLIQQFTPNNPIDAKDDIDNVW